MTFTTTARRRARRPRWSIAIIHTPGTGMCRLRRRPEESTCTTITIRAILTADIIRLREGLTLAATWAMPDGP